MILISFPWISIEFGFLQLHTSVILAVEPSDRDSGNSIVHAQELVTFSSGETGGSVATTNDHSSSSGSHPKHAVLSNASTAAPLNGEITRTSAGESSQDASGHVESNPTEQNGISMFKRYQFFTYQVWRSLILTLI